MSVDPIRAVVLAGERRGGNALARAHGLRSGVLVDVAGISCIARVIDALRNSTAVAGGTIVGPDLDVKMGEAVFDALFAVGDFGWTAPAAGPAASALAATAQIDRYPILLTAADHALLTPAIVDDFCSAARARAADFVVGLVPYARVYAAYPESRRTRIKFTDGPFCGSNLFLLNRPAARRALAFWSALEADRKRPWRMAARLGLMVLWRYLLTGLSANEAFALLSSRSGASIDYVVVDAARAAIDVDSIADLKLACRIVRDE